MLIKVGKFDLHRKHLALAAAGAILTHLLLFFSGHVALSSFSIPSDASRILMLTLDSSLDDGFQDQQEDAETLDEVEVGAAKSISETPPPENTIPITDPTLLPELQPDQEIVSEQALPPPLTDAEGSLIKDAEGSLITDAEGSLITDAEGPLIKDAEGSLITDAEGSLITDAEGSLEEILEGSEEEVALEENNVLTSSDSEVSVPQATAPQSSVTEVSVTKKQRKMLERKIEHFAKQLESGASAQNISWEYKGQSYTANFKHLPAADEMEMDKIEVEVATEQDGQKLTKKMRMKKLAFSNFAQFVNQWDEKVSIHDDELDGRFHSNSKIMLAPNRTASPLFFGKVTTASNRVEIDAIGKRARKKNMFLGGLETGVKKIRMPQPKLLYDDQEIDENSKTYFYAQNTRIVFTADGRYSAESLSKSGDVETSTEIIIGDAPVYIYTSPRAKLYVAGTVHGKVLLYSPKGIVIENSLVYADSDNSELHDNYLGLVSDRDVVIADARVTGPGDLQIDASIYAKRQFKVKNYNSKRAGTLRIHGSVSAGSMSATEPRYATSITFDKRLENIRPPNYPVSDRYELALAEHDWQVELNEDSLPDSDDQPALSEY